MFACPTLFLLLSLKNFFKINSSTSCNLRFDFLSAFLQTMMDSKDKRLVCPPFTRLSQSDEAVLKVYQHHLEQGGWGMLVNEDGRLCGLRGSPAPGPRLCH